jgi:hypothetical protein
MGCHDWRGNASPFRHKEISLHTFGQKPQQMSLVTPASHRPPVEQGRAANASLAAFDLSRIPAHSTASGASHAPATIGLKPDAREDENVFGRTAEELAGDVARPVGRAIGNVIGGAAALLTGLDINAHDTSPATWNPDGSFSWLVGFTTTGRSGFLVQEVNLDWR